MYYPELLTVVGPTACGKTALGVALAEELHGAILSGDSRQVFVGMDIGTGKDLDSYTTERGSIPHYLIDIVPAGQPFNLFEYVRLFDEAYHEVVSQQLKPIFVGGSGLYVEQVLQTKPMHQVPPDATLRQELEQLSLDDLRAILSRYPRIERVDPSSARKCIRAIEIARHYAQYPDQYQAYREALRKAKQQKPPLIIGLRLARQEIIRRIDQRLQRRHAHCVWSGVPLYHLILTGSAELRRDEGAVSNRHSSVCQATDDLVPRHDSPRTTYTLDRRSSAGHLPVRPCVTTA